MLAGLVDHYRVVTTLGVGGMGVVYKAIDTRLNRPVAIKAIRESDDLTTDAVIRLRAEALAAASLDHPYICKIYELLDTSDGTLIVMEFIEGETLATRLARGLPPLAETLRYGSEIAEGLADAHDHGLIHRDVKPSNVMITPHGHVKLLDFGVVRVNAVGSGATTTHSALTRPGGAPGTPLYMAPEQALGLTVTASADIFSLGIVLFECLTGRLPFDGGTRDAYVHAMLTGRKRRLEELAPGVPEPVRRLVDGCLQGEPSRRPETATIVATELRRAADLIGSSGTFPVRTQSEWRTALPGIALFAAASAIIGAVVVWRSISGRELPPLSYRPAITAPSAESDAHVSPDRRWLSFLSDRDGAKGLYLQALDSGDPKRIDVPGDAVVSHAWSPDSREFACVVQQRGAWYLQIVPAFFGGLPRATARLVEPDQSARIVRWIRSGIYVEADRGPAGHSLWRLDADGAHREDLSLHWPPLDRGSRAGIDVEPSGSNIVYTEFVGGRTDLWTAKIDGSDPRRLTDDAFVERDPLWVGETRTIAFASNRGGQLDIWTVDAKSGRSVQLTTSETAETPTDATSDGSIVTYEQRTERASLWLLPAGSHAARQLSNEALSDLFPSSSAGGDWIAFQRRSAVLVEANDFFDARVLVATLSGRERLTAARVAADGFAPRMSPDGAWVAYLQRTGRVPTNILAVRNLRTAETRVISRTAPVAIRSTRLPVDWAGQKVAWSGGFLYYVDHAPSQQQIARVFPSTASAPETIVAGSPRVLQDLRPSADGERLAYLSWLDDRAEFHHLDVRTGNDVVLWKEEATQPGVFLRGWTSEGSVLFLRPRGAPEGTAGTQSTDVVAIASGGVRTIASLAGAFPATARLDPAGSWLYITRVEDGVHNVFAVSTRDGRMRAITNNTQGGVSFSGIEPLADGTIVYTRHEERQDIWFAERRNR